MGWGCVRQLAHPVANRAGKVSVRREVDELGHHDDHGGEAGGPRESEAAQHELCGGRVVDEELDDQHEDADEAEVHRGERDVRRLVELGDVPAKHGRPEAKRGAREAGETRQMERGGRRELQSSSVNELSAAAPSANSAAEARRQKRGGRSAAAEARQQKRGGRSAAGRVEVTAGALLAHPRVVQESSSAHATRGACEAMSTKSSVSAVS